VAISRSCLTNAGSEEEDFPTRTIVSRCAGQYLYQCTRSAGESTALAKVTHFSVYVVAQDFHPELYMELARIFAAAYAKAGDPVHVLQAFLSVFARGAVGSFNAAEYDIQQSMVAGPLKQNISLFGESFILLWVAMLLKKRIVVYCDEAPRLLEFLRCLPLLVWHRKQFDCLSPFVQLNDAQLEDLASQGAYCAGFTDDAVKVRSDLYDVIVDLPAQTLNVNDKAKTDLGMGEFHRNLGGEEHGHCERHAREDGAALQEADGSEGGRPAQPGGTRGTAGGQQVVRAISLQCRSLREHVLNGVQRFYI
jgi:hypothetical protein